MVFIRDNLHSSGACCTQQRLFEIRSSRPTFPDCDVEVALDPSKPSTPSLHVSSAGAGYPEGNGLITLRAGIISTYEWFIQQEVRVRV